MNNNVAMMTTEPDSGARKVGSYDIPDDRPSGTPPPPPPPEQSRGLGWLWWLLGIVVLLALLAWAFQSCFSPAPTDTATPTVEAAAPDAAGEGAAVDNTAVCTAVADYDTLAAAPVITAETPVADVRAYYDQVAAAGGALTSAAASIPTLDLTAFNTALTTLGESITALTGDVVGDAAEGLNAAFTGVNDAIAGVGTAAACP
jgi:hypothetical protein